MFFKNVVFKRALKGHLKTAHFISKGDITFPNFFELSSKGNRIKASL